MNLDPTQRYVSRLTQDSLALVLAGGKGSRLDRLTEWRSKPAVPFGGNFRIIDFTLSNCVNSGIRRIGVLTQYKQHSLIRHVQRGWTFSRSELGEFVELLPAQQWGGERWYAGTADAVFQNMHIISRHAPEYVLVLAGDHVYKMDYGPMIAHHRESGADLTIGCVPVARERAREFGILDVAADSRITGFIEKPDDPPEMKNHSDKSLASMGIYVFGRDFLIHQLALDAENPTSTHDFGRDIIPTLIEDHRVFAYPFGHDGDDGYWRDVGTVDAFWEANLELTHVTPALNLYDRNWPIWTYQEQLPPAKFVFDDDDRRGVAVSSLVSSGCVISGARVSGSLLFSNVRVREHSVIEDAVILPDVDIPDHCRIRRAVLDKRCSLAPGTVIGEDLEADRERYYVTENGVVLVTPSMLGQGYYSYTTSNT